MGWGFYFYATFFQNIDWAVFYLICLFLCWPLKAFYACIEAFFFSFSCIAHSWKLLLHTRCLTECPSDILVLNWTQLGSND